ncbi:hypothetical protein G9A89_010728 [Geosiphon pyriformis]|nr:hypothetical protein G9A89_004918 [Geosiphon pyriformis]KAG9305220.1 hypothetical protein G9A89_010728 [Geosiphon pyriformis]
MTTISKFQPKGVNTLYSLLLSKSSVQQPKISLLSNSSNGPTPRQMLNAVIDKNEIIYIFGGLYSPIDDNNMYTFDKRSAKWLVIESISKEVQPIYGYTATMLDNGKIIYLGGKNTRDKIFRDMNEVLVFDSLEGKWHIQRAFSTKKIAPRFGHTAVLSEFASDKDDLLLLNAEEMKWTIIYTENHGPLHTPGSHTATLYNEYLIIAFGWRNRRQSNEINALDISNGTYKWVNSIIPAENIQTLPFNVPDEKREMKFPLVAAIMACLTIFTMYIIWQVNFRKRKVSKSNGGPRRIKGKAKIDHGDQEAQVCSQPDENASSQPSFKKNSNTET